MRYRIVVTLISLLGGFFMVASLFSIWGFSSGETALLDVIWEMVVAIVLFASAFFLHRSKVAKK